MWFGIASPFTTHPRLPGMQYTLWDVWPTEIQAGHWNQRWWPAMCVSGVAAWQVFQKIFCLFFFVARTRLETFFFNKIPGDSPIFGTFGAHRTIRLPKSCVNDYSIFLFSKTTLRKTGGRNQEVWSFGMTFSFKGVGWLQVSSAFPLGVWAHLKDCKTLWRTEKQASTQWWERNCFFFFKHGHSKYTVYIDIQIVLNTNVRFLKSSIISFSMCSSFARPSAATPPSGRTMPHASIQRPSSLWQSWWATAMSGGHFHAFSCWYCWWFRHLANHLGWCWNPINNGINLATSTGERQISEPSTVGPLTLIEMFKVMSKKRWTTGFFTRRHEFWLP